MSEATPRITAPYLENFQNQTVRLLGKVVQLRGEHATVDAGGQINVILTRVSGPSLPLHIPKQQCKLTVGNRTAISKRAMRWR